MNQGLLAFGLDIAEALVVLTRSREKHKKKKILGKLLIPFPLLLGIRNFVLTSADCQENPLLFYLFGFDG